MGGAGLREWRQSHLISCSHVEGGKQQTLATAQLTPERPLAFRF